MHNPIPPTQSNNYRRSVAVLLFITLFVSYAFFWQARSWNNGSRLMLTYALGDRGTVCIDGLEKQTGDRAFVGGHYYSDKAPGQSLLGLPIYLLAKPFVPSHPLNGPTKRYWFPDYLLTVLTTGILSSLIGVMLYSASLHIGCDQWTSAKIALFYGLATPAFAYSTLFYGHQTVAFLSFAGFLLLRGCAARQSWTGWKMFLAGFLAGYCVVTEYPAVFLSFALLVYAVWTGCPLRRLVSFLGASALCAVLLGTYHTVAFGGPFQLGYFFETDPPFQKIHSAENPLGMTIPSGYRALAILGHIQHGLIWYAPVLLLVPFGIRRFIQQNQYKLVFVILWSFGSLYLLNSSYPVWWGGYSTGPRHLVPSLPFLMLAVAAAVSGKERWMKNVMDLFGLAGFAVCFACVASQFGGRVAPFDSANYHRWTYLWQEIKDGRFLRQNLGNLVVHGQWNYYASGNWAAILVLLIFLLVMLCLLSWKCRPEPKISPQEEPSQIEPNAHR